MFMANLPTKADIKLVISIKKSSKILSHAINGKQNREMEINILTKDDEATQQIQQSKQRHTQNLTDLLLDN